VRDYNKTKFQLQDLFDTPFENWIEYYYDMEDCQRLMEEERADLAAEAEEMQSEDGRKRATVTKNSPQSHKKLPPKSVDECLDGLSILLRQNGG